MSKQTNMADFALFLWGGIFVLRGTPFLSPQPLHTILTTPAHRLKVDAICDLSRLNLFFFTEMHLGKKYKALDVKAAPRIFGETHPVSRVL